MSASVVTKVDEIDINKPNKHILLCISDLEGCVQKFPPIPQGKPQSETLCQTDTFKKIKKLLEKNKRFQVAFLGDYFDNGPNIVSTINGIADLINKHGDRVHIILGNRDVNKMRIMVESTLTFNPSINTDDWGDWAGNWKNFLKNTHLNSLDPLNKTKKLLASTYGAAKLLEFVDNNENEGFNKMKAIFSNESFEDDFVKNCKKLYKHGKLIEVITLNKTNILVSHAGTYNLNMFRVTNDFLNDFVIETLNGDNYFEKMEEFREKLSTTSLSERAQLSTAIDFYNKTIYKSVLEKLLSKSINELLIDPDFCKKYLILQAMGLKPNENSPTNFISPIDSCGILGCVHVKKIPDDFADFIKGGSKGNNIDVIAHGHIPFCGTVPLIHGETIQVRNLYENYLGFLACDTSAGNRPKVEIENDGVDTPLKIIPLGYITETAIGIASIHGDGDNTTLSRNDEGPKGYDNSGEKSDTFQFMINEFNLNKLPTPTVDDNGEGFKQVDYHNGKSFSFNGIITDNIFDKFKPSTGVTTGGKLKSKKNKSLKRKKTRKIKKHNRCTNRRCKHI